jgi:hypothetical protein
MPNRCALQWLAASLVAAAMAYGPQSTFAQGSGLFTGSGLSKGGTGGITGNLGATGFGSMTSGKAGATGGAGGLNPFGMQGGGGTGLGGTGAQGGAGIGGAMGAANSGFIGRNSGTFAGNARAGQAGAGARGGATRNFSRTGNSGANDLRNSEFAGGGKERKTSQVRPRQKVAFEYNVKAAETVAATASVRMDRITLKNPSLKGVAVAVQDNQIVLRGKVKTPEQARLAENLVRLEPGVRSVRNELEVEQPAVAE